jgi:hypothetical protein
MRLVCKVKSSAVYSVTVLDSIANLMVLYPFYFQTETLKSRRALIFAGTKFTDLRPTDM